MVRFRFVGSVRWPVVLRRRPTVVQSGVVRRSSVRNWVLVFASAKREERAAAGGRQRRTRRGLLPLAVEAGASGLER